MPVMLRRLLFSLPLALCLAGQDASPERFASAIAAFEEADRTAPPPRQGILFIGSSIFRLWKNLPAQMAPLPVFNRAFGGSRTADLLHYFDRVVLPYQPKVIVYYCGSNDVNAKLTAGEIAAGFERFVERVHAKWPETRLLYVSINRAPQKRELWNVVDQANARVQAFCQRDRRLTYVDVNPALFTPDGEPRHELYLPDKLHFREPAYEAFTAIVRPALEKVWQSVQ